MIMRGVSNLTGNDLDIREASKEFLGEKFLPLLQNLVGELRGMGKRVYILGENPVFPYRNQPKDFVARPFSILPQKSEPPTLAREDVYRHQKDYLDMLSAIEGAEIINGIDFLCPETLLSKIK